MPYDSYGNWIPEERPLWELPKQPVVDLTSQRPVIDLTRSERSLVPDYSVQRPTLVDLTPKQPLIDLTPKRPDFIQIQELPRLDTRFREDFTRIPGLTPEGKETLTAIKYGDPQGLTPYGRDLIDNMRAGLPPGATPALRQALHPGSI